LTARGRSALLAWTALLIAGLVAAIAAPLAEGAQTATLDVKFSPERLGAPTAISFGFEIKAVGGGLPSALSGIDFHYPSDFGLGTSGLGVAACSPATLSERGPKACPRNSIMGAGSAIARFQVSPEISEETANLALVAGPSRGGYIDLLISATGISPIAARVVMAGLLLPGRLRFSVPLVPGVPEGPDVAVVRVKATIGGNLTYYESRHNKRVAYHPTGVLLPRHCPHGGFRFNATFSFVDGTQAQASTVVRCLR